LPIELAPEEADVLAEVLSEYLSDLRMEISDTDSMDFRTRLKRKQSLLKDVLAKIRNSRAGGTRLA
jgi:hypothetical protein